MTEHQNKNSQALIFRLISNFLENKVPIFLNWWKRAYLQSFTVLLDFSISLTGTPKVDILVAELFLQKLGERVETGWVGQQLVKVGRPSANPADVLLSGVCLYQKTFSHRHKDRTKKSWMDYEFNRCLIFTFF